MSRYKVVGAWPGLVYSVKQPNLHRADVGVPDVWWLPRPLVANVRGSKDVRNARSKDLQDLRMCLMRSKSHYFTTERLTQFGKPKMQLPVATSSKRKSHYRPRERCSRDTLKRIWSVISGSGLSQVSGLSAHKKDGALKAKTLNPLLTIFPSIPTWACCGSHT
jgi:hypothetical protein